MSAEHILEAIASSFISSAEKDNFKGILASRLLGIVENPERLKHAIAELISNAQITAIFSRFEVNIHIKRFPDLSIPEQLEYLKTEVLGNFCLYPTATEVQRRVDLSVWHDRPFSKALLLAEPQLAFRAFEMGALERYVSDPRYSVNFFDYMGEMSISGEYYRNEHHPERDKVGLQTFGLGFDADRVPYIIVYLRYLSGLSAEHQQYWKSYLTSGHVRMSKPYYRSSIEGKFLDNHSVRNAIAEQMRLIRELSKAIWGRSLFRDPAIDDVPIGLTSFLRPTAENFNRFVVALDKLLSESINKSFFKGKCQLETEQTRPDGKLEIKQKGTITLLEEWLLKEIIWEDPDGFRKVVIEPLRRVRKLRQEPVHTFTTDNFSAEYYEKRKRLLCDVFNSLSNIRATFAKHPLAKAIKVPDWLENAQIDVF